MTTDTHHLVGFHDYDPWASTGDKILALEVDFMSRPVVVGDVARVGLLDVERDVFLPLAETTAWNFPQGARQQWLRRWESQAFVFNRFADGEWRAAIYEGEGGRLRGLDQSVYALSPSSDIGYGLNFARLHRLGGYGYVGGRDATQAEAAPESDGIWKVDLRTGRTSLMVSISDVVACGGITRIPTGTVHYLTHVVPSPAGRSLAFLHRYWLPDGGIQTRLMTCSDDGSSLECRADGFLSHFDWLNEEDVLIWGRVADRLQQARSSGILSLPVLAPMLRAAKPFVRQLLKKSTSLRGSYLRIGKKGELVEKVAPDRLTEDGHPSLKPGTRDVILSDTYPDKQGWRRLFLFDCASETVQELARLQQAQTMPDASQLERATVGMDARALVAFSSEHFAYSRSGIHCDFHPRWRTDGRAVCFDSNHGGSRRVYTLNLDE